MFKIPRVCYSSGSLALFLPTTATAMAAVIASTMLCLGFHIALVVALEKASTMLYLIHHPKTPLAVATASIMLSLIVIPETASTSDLLEYSLLGSIDDEEEGGEEEEVEFMGEWTMRRTTTGLTAETINAFKCYELESEEAVSKLLSWCSLCLEQAELGESWIETPRCRHFYHYNCARAYFDRSKVCTICREKFNNVGEE